MPTIQFDTSLPSVRQVQNLIKEATVLELKLLTGEMLSGKILWQDSDCVSVVDENNQQTIIWKQALAYLKVKS